MPDDRRPKTREHRFLTQSHVRGLVHDRRLPAQGGAQFIESRLLEHDQPCRHAKRLPRLGVLADVPVKIGPGQRQHQRRIGPLPFEFRDRGIALVGVERQQHVVRTAVPLRVHAHPVPQAAQKSPPPRGRMPVAAAGNSGGRNGDGDFHVTAIVLGPDEHHTGTACRWTLT